MPHFVIFRWQVLEGSHEQSSNNIFWGNGSSPGLGRGLGSNLNFFTNQTGLRSLNFIKMFDSGFLPYTGLFHISIPLFIVCFWGLKCFISSPFPTLYLEILPVFKDLGQRESPFFRKVSLTYQARIGPHL